VLAANGREPRYPTIRQSGTFFRLFPVFQILAGYLEIRWDGEQPPNHQLPFIGTPQLFAGKALHLLKLPVNAPERFGDIGINGALKRPGILDLM
jgi:hypothetical protein